MSRVDQAQRARAVDLGKLESDVAAALSDLPVVSEVPSVQSASVQPAMPDYIEHQVGVSRAGALSAEAVLRDYEAAAKEIEAMGEELVSAARKCEAMTAQVHDAIAYTRETAAAYREEAKKIFRRIEDCTLLTEQVRETCTALKQKIEGNGRI